MSNSEWNADQAHGERVQRGWEDELKTLHAFGDGGRRMKAHYCPSCGRLASEPCGECDRLRAEVKDLKARLRAARRGQMGMPCPTIGSGLGLCWCSECVGLRAADLRVKNWRKP